MRFPNPITSICIISMILSLACSGGGGGGTPASTPPPAPVISSFVAAQGTIAQGASTTLTGVFTNGTGSINSGVGGVQSGVAVSTGTLQATTTFVLSVTGSGGTASFSTTVTILPNPIIASFAAAQGTITQGASTTLTGVFTNGTGSVNNGVGSVQSGVAISTGSLSATTTFILSVTGNGNTVSSSTTVTVLLIPVINSFAAAQGTITQGASTTLTGVFTNGTGSINNGVGGVQSGVAVSTGTLQATTTFILTVTGSGSTATSSATVNIITKTIADTLTYVDPVSSGFRLIRNAGLSSAAKLVLDLMGPSGTGQGVAFIVNADQSKVTWSNPPSIGTMVQNVAFNLGMGTQAFAVKVTGNQLQGAAFQKPGSVAVNLAQPLMRISLDLKPGIPVNTTVAMSFTAGNQLPSSGGPSNITVAVGSLVAQ